MKTDNIISWIKRGVNYETSFLRQSVVASGLFFLFPLYFRLRHSEGSLGISVTMLMFSFVSIIIIFILTAGQRTTKKRLLINLIFPIYLMINLLLFATAVFILAFDLQPIIIFIYLPPILTATFTFFKTKSILKSDTYSSENIKINSLGLAGALTGISGMVSVFLECGLEKFSLIISLKMRALFL